MDRILNMILRQLIRHGVNFGIRKGADLLASRHAPEDEAQMKKKGAETARHARQMMRVGRRVTRL